MTQTLGMACWAEISRKNVKLAKTTYLMISNVVIKSGRGGGASGRAVAFCPSRPGSIPGTDLLGFFRFRIAANLFSLGAGLFF